MAGTSGGRPSIYPTLLYADAKAAIRQLTEALGFTELSVYEGEDGSVLHAELVQGNGAVMVGSKGRGGLFDAAMKDSGTTGVYVVVDDVDAHHRRALDHGTEIIMPPTDQDYGSRTTWPGTSRAMCGASARTRPRQGADGRPVQLPPVCTWKAARRTALARAGSGCAAASATRTCTVRG
ncbi:hypothetical protein SALBM311S_10794 [Streptomyces alboniger]